MMRITPCFLLALLLLTYCKGYGQQQLKIEGLVTDQRHKPLPGVTITLKYLPDSSTIASLATDTKGLYIFQLLKPGKYFAQARFLGFKNKLSSIIIIPGKQPETIIMEETSKNLKEIIVTAKQQAVEMQAGKLIYNIDKSITATGSSAFELLQRTPGISTDQDENLVLKGSPNVNVMIDGKMTYLSARQLSSLLKSTPAINIMNIEVITTPSAKYDAAGNNGIINIVTKKNNKKGYAAELSTGITGGQYLSNMQSMAGNIKTSRLNFFGTYSYSYDHSTFHRSSLRLADNNGAVTIYDRRSEDPSIGKYNSYKAGVDIDLSKNQQIGIIYNGNTDTWSRDGSGPTFLRNADNAATAVVQNHNITREPNSNNAYQLNYKATLDTLGGKITADADYAIYHNNSKGTQDNQLFDLDGNQLQAFQSLRISQPSNISIHSVKSDLVLPLGKIKLQTGVKYASIKTDNNFVYDSLINNNYVIAPYLSNHFIYTENVAAAYLSATRKWNNISIDAGLRAEHTQSNGELLSVSGNTDYKRSYTNLFLSLALDYRVNTTHKIGLSLSRRINRPAYSELNPSRYYFDKFSYYQGNPNLQPELSWVASVNYSLFDKYIATLSYTRTTGLIAEQSIQDVTTGIMVLTNKNFAHSNLFDLMFSVPITVSDNWEMNNTADFYYQAYANQIGAVEYNLHRYTADLSTIQTYKLRDGFAVEARAKYTSPALSGTYLLRYYFSADAGAKKSLFNNKLEAKLSVTDIFKTIHFWADNVANLQASYNHTRDSRRVSLSLVYHFGGKFTNREVNKLEEQDRL
ncbi:outer membrane beta-barrel protein [Mucilaginibacter gilvus]|uniref:TonB-dependent receptor n=1 Tax=Mucilaginibacter gilvus TaxID=2305909 RepID=A0A444MI50_9SPHI|nr:outer membrane beta-barrel protein [Mucilaginibacter gilvus]RWY47462.1 TonB-dependent receptor [Mucilaginibacter gilvus]